MAILLVVFGVIWVVAGALVGMTAPSDIQITLSAVFFTGALTAFGLAVLLGRVKANAESLARIEHYLATKEDETNIKS